MAHKAQGVHAVAGDEKIEANEVFGAIVGKFIVEASVAGSDRFELVVEIGEEVRHRGFKINHGAIFDIT